MKKYYGTTSFSIMLNGSSVEFFHSSRGLRQGDHLSPFIFLFVAEAFGALLSKAFSRGLLEGFMVRANGMMVSHLQFAADTLIMCKASEEQVKYLRCVIKCFEVVFGLKVNLLKSRMYRVGSMDQIDKLAECLGCSVGHLPTTYLGLPLGVSYKSIVYWNPIVSRIQKMLAG